MFKPVLLATVAEGLSM